ncbi:hypothetical protein [Larkinella sp.]|uniref:hypothetical protein n=1 Tax=Larkinella sp. TaxID=2034517 RepID=UPI003BA91EF8
MPNFKGRENCRKTADDNGFWYWDAVTAITGSLYNDRLLFHFTEQKGNTSQQNETLRFYWKKSGVGNRFNGS